MKKETATFESDFQIKGRKSEDSKKRFKRMSQRQDKLNSHKNNKGRRNYFRAEQGDTYCDSFSRIVTKGTISSQTQMKVELASD